MNGYPSSISRMVWVIERSSRSLAVPRAKLASPEAAAAS
jgi:hypothetical protein